MPITTNDLTKAQFDLQLSNLLGQLEGRKPKPYLDTAQGQSHATIGIGIDLTVEANHNSVFTKMGIPVRLQA
jgi:GH24 family phage-related lysozyme (muramidase)